VPNGVRCPHCGSSRLHRDGYTEKGAAKYHCLNCHEYLNDLTKTIFEHHKFPIEEMFYILKEMENKSTLQIRGTYEGDKPPVQTFTERRGKTRSKGTRQETIRKRHLKQSLRVR